MTWPSVTINQYNTYSSTPEGIENTLLFVGKAKKNNGNVMPVNANSDLDALLGSNECALKNCVQAALLNAGQNAFFYVCVLPEQEGSGESTPRTSTELWRNAILKAQETISAEGIVLTEPVSTKDEINAAQALRQSITEKYQRWVWFILTVAANDRTQSWAEYIATLTTLQKGIAAPQVMLVPEIFGNEPGVLAGRLCNSAVTIADSPARVATGALSGLKTTTRPTDKDGMPVDLDTLQALAGARYSVPMWYADYDGLYWADGVTLEVNGGDYNVIEHVRIADKAARRVRLMALPKIADRALNSTSGSIAAHETLFAAPLRTMAKSVQINGVTFPGEIKPPQNGDVKIVWVNEKTVSIWIIVRPYACPKEIRVGIQLDYSLEDDA
ncbi:DUF2586 family protein [Escherichia coli]|uniref:DUF2586 domain-containing protein n=1 Tax=Escherichia coli TaxID=562 RepID=UPI0018A16B88|nr:DUF2586 domain-containing protein [Escherichia coli]EGY0127514.1 DUF2586 family protein [Escherichia coli]EHL3384134.1 DUF2586 family protein [Escherichia coli]HBE9076496.1 DUF2586 family protein [Escherichia coli]HDV1218635.1 DUF2586 family protein [Escherichia coli]HDX7431697.1 DUF2586 family protein [Escherichia coli]